MKEFLLIFRMDIVSKEAQPSDEQMALYMQSWMAWIEQIAKSGQLAAGGNHLNPNGLVVEPGDRVSNGPYVAANQSVAGYIIILSADIAKALEIAKKCPILQGANTSVEIRETATPQNMRDAGS